MFQSFSYKFVERYKTAICLNEQVILHRFVIFLKTQKESLLQKIYLHK